MVLLMQYGDIEGKGKIYSTSGELLLDKNEKIISQTSGILLRGWVRYKLGWRTIMFKGYGGFFITNKRLVYLELPEFIEKIHTVNLDHELGDFGGWDYHAHRLRRAAALEAFMFFELPRNEINDFKHKKDRTLILSKDKKHHTRS
jgi:hypothetical protein